MDLNTVLQVATLLTILVGIATFFIKKDWSVHTQLIELHNDVKDTQTEVTTIKTNCLPHIASDLKDVKSKQIDMDKKLYAHLKNHK